MNQRNVMDDNAVIDLDGEKSEYELLRDRRVAECRAAAQPVEAAANEL